MMMINPCGWVCIKKKWMTLKIIAVNISVTDMVHCAGSTSKPANRVKFCPIGA